jgi:ribosomal protein L29
MSSKTFDLREMTAEDLFRAKKERRQRLARLPFEEKIEIVKKLQPVSRGARAEA